MKLSEILAESSMRHRHLCPRQVLGVRMVLYAGELLGLEIPRRDKRLLITSETDGCAVDGIIAASHCRVGSRTLRVLDLGKVAATFTDIHTDTSVRVIPRREARELAIEYAPLAKNDWEAMLLGYQAMPIDVLLTAQPVRLTLPLSEIISRPGKKTVCEACGEEIINGREVLRGNLPFCLTCVGSGYYRNLQTSLNKEEGINLLFHD